MLNTYGNTDKCLPLSLQSCSRSPRSFCSRLPFLPLGTEWEERTWGRYSFLNHHRLHCMICFPLEGTLMILSPNDICLRPIRTPHPDNTSTGIMSGWISSAPVRWAGDKFGKWDRWDYISSATSWAIPCKMKPTWFLVARLDVSFLSCRGTITDSSGSTVRRSLSGSAGEAHRAISYLQSFILFFSIGALLGSEKKKTLQHVLLLASFLFSFHMECFSKMIRLLVSHIAFKLSS